MLLVALGFLFGLVILVWWFVLSVTGADSFSTGHKLISVPNRQTELRLDKSGTA